MDFGIAPTIISGDVTIDGTSFTPTSTDGGVVLLEGINLTSLTYNNPDFGNGVNFAFFAEATPVPEPLTSLAFGTALAFGFLFKKRKDAHKS